MTRNEKTIARLGCGGLLLYATFALALWAAVIFVAVHFITKWW